jgi:flagellar biosynthesis protein FlhG
MEHRTQLIDRASRIQDRALLPADAATGTRAGDDSRGGVRRPPPDRTPSVWSVGGGKGGVGKSLITSSLAACFARRGLRCAVVDADLGGANLHTLLGICKPEATLSQFLAREISDLSEVMCETTIPNLWLVSGASASPSAANPKHSQKLKLIRHLRRLQVDHVFLDLGAGCTYNVLDFFLSAEHPILVAAPEPTSIDNTYHFLKAAFYRWLGSVAKQSDVRETIDRVLAENPGKKLGSPRDLVAAVSAIDPAAGQALHERARSFAPLLIINKARNAAHRSMGREIADTCRGYLGARVEYCGVVERDDCVHAAVNHCRPVLEIAPNSAFSRDVEVIAERLIKDHAVARHPSIAPVESLECERFDVYEQCRLASYGLLSDTNPSPAPPPEEPPALEPPPLPPLGDMDPGAHLKRCREALGLSIEELSQTTRIFSLRNIENEYYDLLPPNPYMRGLVLQYARALGIVEAETVADAFIKRYRNAPAAA